MKKTKIEWCDSTWNPVTGCLHKCEYCYARRMARRFCTNEHGHDGLLAPCDGDCRACSEMDGIEFVGDDVRFSHGEGPYPYGFMPTFHQNRLNEPARMSKGRNIFVCSMADLFGDWVPDKWIRDVFAACQAAPQHNYLFLTKNPQRYGDLNDAAILPNDPNFWYGSTITQKNEHKLNRFAPHYCETPILTHRNTFLSVEPLLDDSLGELIKYYGYCYKWVIVGVETGNRKGKVAPQSAWIEEIVKECRRYNIPLFMKDSLIPVVGAENMIREFPENLRGGSHE